MEDGNHALFILILAKQLQNENKEKGDPHPITIRNAIKLEKRMRTVIEEEIRDLRLQDPAHI